MCRTAHTNWKPRDAVSSTWKSDNRTSRHRPWSQRRRSRRSAGPVWATRPRSGSWSRATRGVLLASPSNQTGTAIPREELRAIIASVRGSGGFVVMDEIYQGLVYDGEASTVLELADDVFVVNSFSKYFNMTGWRLGWIVAPEIYVREIENPA